MIFVGKKVIWEGVNTESGANIVVFDDMTAMQCEGMTEIVDGMSYLKSTFGPHMDVAKGIVKLGELLDEHGKKSSAEDPQQRG